MKITSIFGAALALVVASTSLSYAGNFGGGGNKPNPGGNASATVNNNNINANINVNKADANAKAKASSRSYSASQSKSSVKNSGNSQNDNRSTSNVSVSGDEAADIPVSTAYAPNLTAAAAVGTCGVVISTSGGLQLEVVGISGGDSEVVWDYRCAYTSIAASYAAIGKHKEAEAALEKAVAWVDQQSGVVVNKTLDNNVADASKVQSLYKFPKKKEVNHYDMDDREQP